MDDFDRYQTEKAIGLLDSWLHSGVVDEPHGLLLDAIHVAVKHMQRIDSARTMPLYKRACAVLNYHIGHPHAELFRDLVTIDAIKTGIDVLKRQLNRQT